MNFLFSFFHKKDISLVIIRIEIKMKISRLGDKFDRSMTRDKLLGNNALLFIFISKKRIHFITDTYLSAFLLHRIQYFSVLLAHQNTLFKCSISSGNIYNSEE